MEFFSPTWIQGPIQTYGLLVLFILVMVDSVGVPVPGETALVAAALYAGTTNEIGITSVVIVAAIAAIVGDNIGYLLGRSTGIGLVARYGSYVRLNQARLKVVQYLYLAHGGKIIFFARFLAFIRVFAAFLAGVNQMDFRRFLIVNAIGGISWALLIGGSAFLLGEQMKSVEGPLSSLLLIATIVVVVAAIVFFKRHEQGLEQRAEAALPGLLMQ
jgi:membrane protein DedA with SNARE-associated domain